MRMLCNGHDRKCDFVNQGHSSKQMRVQQRFKFFDEFVYNVVCWLWRQQTIDFDLNQKKGRHLLEMRDFQVFLLKLWCGLVTWVRQLQQLAVWFPSAIRRVGIYPKRRPFEKSNYSFYLTVTIIGILSFIIVDNNIFRNDNIKGID